MDLNPFSMFGKTMETFTKMMEDSSARSEAFFAEFAKQDEVRMEKANSAINEIARLQKETLAYSAKMGAEMRKASTEMMKSTMDKMTSFASSSATKAA